MFYYMSNVEISGSLKGRKFIQYLKSVMYEGRNFNSGNYLFTTDTK